MSKIVINAEFKGLDVFERKLSMLSQDVAGPALVKGMETGGKVLKQEMQNEIESHGNVRTRTLLESIKTKKVIHPTMAGVIVGPDVNAKGVDDKGNTVKVGKYVHFVNIINQFTLNAAKKSKTRMIESMTSYLTKVLNKYKL